MEVPGSQGHLGRDFPLAPSQGPWHEEAGRQDGCTEQGESLEVGSGALRLSPPHIPQALSARGTQSPPGAAGSKPLGGQRQLPAGWTRAPSENHPGGTRQLHTQWQGQSGKGPAPGPHLDVLLRQALLHRVRRVLPDAMQECLEERSRER